MLNFLLPLHYYENIEVKNEKNEKNRNMINNSAILQFPFTTTQMSFKLSLERSPPISVHDAVQLGLDPA